MLLGLVLAVIVAAAPASATASNDAFADAIDAATLPFVHTTDSSGATTEIGEPVPSCGVVGSTLWYRVATAGRIDVSTFGSKYDTVVTVYKGTGLGDLTEVACNDDATDVGSQQSRLNFGSRPGQTYFLQVGGYGTAAGLTKITITLGLNDDFAEALEISALPFAHTTSTAAATTEPGEPAPCGSIGKTVWYSLEVSEDTDIVADTLDSNFDTVLAAYTGTDLASLTPVACNDEGEFTSQSVITFTAVAGTTYHLQAAGWDGNQGTLVLNVKAAGTDPNTGPANNAFANATPVDGETFGDEVDTTGATTEPNEPGPSCAPGGASVWYRLIVSQDRALLIDTTGSEYDTVLAVYTGDSLETLEEETPGCIDDVVPAVVTASALPLRATAGTTYYIQVSGYDGAAGFLTFFVTPVA